MIASPPIREPHKWCSRVSARLQFDVVDADDGPVIRGLDAGAAGVFEHVDVVRVPGPEQDPVLGKHANFFFEGMGVDGGGASYCVRWCPLFGAGVIHVTANVKLIRGQEVDPGLPKTFEDRTWKRHIICIQFHSVV